MSVNKVARTIYLYVVSLIALIFILVNAGLLINMGLQTWVFTKADRADYYPSFPSGPKEYLDPSTGRPTGDQNKDLAEELKKNPDLTDKQKSQINAWLADYEKAKTEQGDLATQRSARRQRDASRSLAQLIVAVPVFLYNWKLVRRERDSNS